MTLNSFGISPVGTLSICIYLTPYLFCMAYLAQCDSQIITQ
jgi:hypothetical protein